MEKKGNKRKYDGMRLETAVVALWIDEEEPSRQYWQEQARRWRTQEQGVLGLMHQLADEIRPTENLLPYCLHRLLLDFGLARVYWYQVAVHLFGQFEESQEK